jgi:hypothetical protein
MLAPRIAAAFGAVLMSAIVTIGLPGSACAATESAAAACPRLPQVAWWDTTPEKIINYVDTAFHGDWDPYIAKWETYRIKMTQIRDSHGAAIVRSRGLRLEGDSLVDHIRDIDQRIKVTLCLKEHFNGKYV